MSGGGIAVLLVILGIESVAYLSFSSAIGKLLGELDKAEEQTEYDLTKSVVTKAVGGKEPTRSEPIWEGAGEGRLDVYVWKGVLKDRTLYVRYGVSGMQGEPQVMSVSPNLQNR